MVAQKAAIKTKAAPRAAEPDRAAPAAEERVAPRIAVPKDRAVTIGRDGQPIWRKQRAGEGVDQYTIPQGMEPDGWKYEWKRSQIWNRPDTQHQVNVRRNGWTDVPASRHDGVWMPAGHPGNIEINGLILMEIPLALWQEATNEDKRRASEQVMQSRRSAGMKATDLADPTHPSLKGARFVRQELTPVLNQNKYEYTLDE